jgi:hypothetical protein
MNKKCYMLPVSGYVLCLGARLEAHAEVSPGKSAMRFRSSRIRCFRKALRVVEYHQVHMLVDQTSAAIAAALPGQLWCQQLKARYGTAEQLHASCWAQLA